MSGVWWALLAVICNLGLASAPWFVGNIPATAADLALAVLCALPVSGGISAGLAGGLVPWLLRQPPLVVIGCAVLTAVGVRLPPNVRRWLNLSGVVIASAGFITHREIEILASALLAQQLALLLAPAKSRPLGCATIINTVAGHSAFLAVCVIMVVVQPALWLSGSHRVAITAWLMRAAGRIVLNAAPFAGWRWQISSSLPSVPAVMISNHQSVLDILACLALPGRPRVMLAKSWVFRVPFLGWAARFGGVLPITVLATGNFHQIPPTHDLVVFPEGTRSAHGQLRRFRSGAVQAADDLHRPLIAACQFGSGALFERGDWWVRPGSMMTRVMSVPALPAGSRAQRSAALRTWMQAQLGVVHPQSRFLSFCAAWEYNAQRGIFARWRALRKAGHSNLNCV